VLDSNQRRRKPADLQSAPVGHLGNLPKQITAAELPHILSFVKRENHFAQIKIKGKFIPRLSRRDFNFLDGGAQFFFDPFLPFAGQDLAATDFAHGKIINGRAALGDNPRGGNIELQFSERLRDGVKQTQPVFGFDFDARAFVGGRVIKLNLRFDAFAEVGLIRGLRRLAGDERG
jgi:hypothetical protein